MTMKKLNLAYIANDSKRRETFNKRKKGFFKKLDEISVLCGTEACAVIYNPFNSNPEVWPSNLGVKNVVDKFEMMPEMEQENKMVNHESFLEQNISKITAKNKKNMEDNAEKSMKEVMFLLLRGNGETLSLTNRNRNDLCKYIDQYLKQLYHHRNQTLNQSQFQFGESSSATNLVAPTSLLEMGSSSFPNLDVFNLSQPTNDLWSLPQNNAISSTFVGQQDNYPIDVFNQNPNWNHPNLNQYQQDQFEYPNVVQDGIFNQDQTHDQQEQCLDPLKDNSSYHHQS